MTKYVEMLSSERLQAPSSPSNQINNSLNNNNNNIINNNNCCGSVPSASSNMYNSTSIGGCGISNNMDSSNKEKDHYVKPPGKIIINLLVFGNQCVLMIYISFLQLAIFAQIFLLSVFHSNLKLYSCFILPLPCRYLYTAKNKSKHVRNNRAILRSNEITN